MTEKNAPEATKAPKPFPFRAARASWMTPLLVFTFAGVIQRASETKSAFSVLVTGGVVIFLLGCGILLGVIGLPGIKRHGKIGLLLPSIVGLLLNGASLYVLLSVAVSAFRRVTAA